MDFTPTNRRTRRFAGIAIAVVLSFLLVCRLTAARSSQKAVQNDQEFFAAANQVLQTMSKILNLPVKSPLAKSIRTKAEIRAYLVEGQKKDETPQQRYADQKTLEAFGLIPKDFPLDSFLIDLLTDQVAGLYDAKKKEFFIADWIPAIEQKPVMAHELTHALDDEYFHLAKWQKAVKSNDDASLARDAVVEGSAVAAMLDYSLQDLHTSVREMPDIAPFIETSVAGEMDKDPNLAKAPPFIRDELLFPYLEGAEFSQQVLKRTSGWADFKEVFENPPVSTQEILHPELYFRHEAQHDVRLPNFKSALPPGYRKLDENVVGEFALSEILKKYVGPGDAERFAPLWDGDRYVIFENANTQQTILIVLYAFKKAQDADEFFPPLLRALEKKHGASAVAQGPDLAQFGDDVLLRCFQEECLSIEGADSATAQRIEKKLNWPPAELGSIARQRKIENFGEFKSDRAIE